MKKIILPFLCLFCLQVHAQHKTSIDLILGVEHTFRYFEADVDTLNLRSTEKSKINWRYGFNVNMRLNNSMFLKSGLRISNLGYTISEMDGLRWPSENVDGMWVPDPTLPHEIKIVLNDHYLEIPISVRKEFNGRKFSPFVEFGPSLNIHLSSNLKQTTDIDPKGTSTAHAVPDFNPFQIAVSAGVGTNYDLNEKLQLFGQFNYRHHLTKVGQSNVANERLYNCGLELGLRMKFDLEDN